MRHLPWKESCWAIATLLLLAALYVFAYWLTATPESEMLALPDGGEFPFPVFDEMIVDPPPGFVDATKIVGEQTVPERSARVKVRYLFLGDFVRPFFAPIHEFDLQWRFRYWHVETTRFL